jgi:hypothetical protein
MSVRETLATGLPHTLGFLRFAEGVEPAPTKPFPNQVTFPIYREGELEELKQMLLTKRIVAMGSCTARDGLRVGFATEEDAVLAKMSFTV